MTFRTAQSITTAGTAPDFDPVTATDTMYVGDRVWAEYRSTHSAATTVTLVIPGTLATGDAYPDKVYTLPAGNVTPTEIRIPLLKDARDPSTGVASITTSQQTGVEMAVVRR